MCVFVSFTKSYVINYLHPLSYIKVIVNAIDERYLLNISVITLFLFKFLSTLNPSTNLPPLFTEILSVKLFEIALCYPLFEQVNWILFLSI